MQGNPIPTPASIGAQPFDVELSAIAALPTTAGGFLVGNGSTWTVQSGLDARTELGLGSAATVNTGTTSGTVPVLGTGGRLDQARMPAYTEIALTPINSFTAPAGESNRLFVYPDGSAELFFALSHASIPAAGTVALSWDVAYQALGQTYPVTASTGVADIFRMAITQNTSSLLFSKLSGPSSTVFFSRGSIRFRWQ